MNNIINTENTLPSLGVVVVHTSDKQLICQCPFCHSTSKSKKPRLYVKRDTGQYYCHNCGDKGNLVTLSKKLGKDLLTENNHFPVPSIYTGNQKSDSNVTAINIWEKSVEASKDHPYLLKKSIQSHIAKQNGNNLVIPIYDDNGSLSSLQYIQPDGTKRFLKGGHTSGSYSLIGEITNTIYVAEGFATACSIYEATGEATAICFSCNNLAKVVAALQNKYSNRELVICGDIDSKGKETATNTAGKNAVKLVLPSFKQEAGEYNDFNDIHKLYGLEELKRQLELADRIQDTRFPFVNFKEFMVNNYGKTEWLVKDLLTTDGLSLLVAKPKVGKSTLARQLAVCVASGNQFLGREVKQGYVVYITFEEPKQRIQEHFTKIDSKSYLPMSIYADTDKPEDTILWLTDEIKRIKPVLVIVDTLFRFTKAKQINDYTEITEVLNPILAIARKYSTHILCIHHANKGGSDDGNAVLGSTSIFGTTDTLINLVRKDNVIAISTEQRYGEGMPSTILNLDKDSMTYSLGMTKSQSNLERVREDILSFLDTYDSPIIAKELEENIEAKSKVFDTALKELLAENLIQRTGTGKKGNPYLYSKLTNEAVSDSFNNLSQTAE